MTLLKLLALHMLGGVACLPAGSLTSLQCLEAVSAALLDIAQVWGTKSF